MFSWVLKAIENKFGVAGNTNPTVQPVFDVKFQNTGPKSFNNVYHHVNMIFGHNTSQIKFRIDIHKDYIDEAITDLTKVRDRLKMYQEGNYDENVLQFIGDSKFFFAPAFYIIPIINPKIIDQVVFKVCPIKTHTSGADFELILQTDQLLSLDHYLDIIIDILENDCCCCGDGCRCQHISDNCVEFRPQSPLGNVRRRIGFENFL